MSLAFEDYDNRCGHFTDGITINGKHSYKDFNLYIAARKFEAPKKKSIRVSVPHSNGFYDFSAINGDATYSERSVSYAFDVLGDDVRDLEHRRSMVYDWLSAATNSRIDDDALENFHLIGSIDDISPDDDETGELTRITASFICYPFKIANTPNVVGLRTGSNAIYNRGKVTIPTVRSGAAGILTVREIAINIPEHSEMRLSVPLTAGLNEISCTVPMTLIYYDEVI